MSATTVLAMPPARKMAATASARADRVPSGSPSVSRLLLLATRITPGSITVQDE